MSAASELIELLELFQEHKPNLRIGQILAGALAEDPMWKVPNPRGALYMMPDSVLQKRLLDYAYWIEEQDANSPDRARGGQGSTRQAKAARKSSGAA